MTAAGIHRLRLVRGAQALLRKYQPLRFLIVGGFNTAMCYLVYAALVWAGVAFWLANLCALFFGIGLSFITQGRFVFGNRDASRFWRFAATWFAIYLVQTGVIKLLIHAGIGPALSGLIVLPGTAVASYLIQKWVVFHKSEPVA